MLNPKDHRASAVDPQITLIRHRIGELEGELTCAVSERELARRDVRTMQKLYTEQTYALSDANREVLVWRIAVVGGIVFALGARALGCCDPRD
jgi:hypothetical protein